MDEKKTASSGSDRAKRSKDPVCEHLSFAAKEAFKRLRTNLVMSFPEDDPSCKMVGVTSAQPSDGKSTVAISLAYSLAELDKKVLLIDADLRRSSIHLKAGVKKSPGLSDLMAGTNSIASALKKYNSKTGTSFEILTSGESPQNPSEMLNSSRMSLLLQKLATVYDYIVLDLPPIGAVVDAVSVSRELDGMLVVIRENTCPRGLLSECISQMNYANINILGFVVNGALEGSGKKYQYNKYGYYNKGYY